MGAAREYADARLEHYKALRGHDHRERKTREQQSADLWAKLDGEQKKEAAEAYFLAIQKFERTQKR